MGHPLVKCAEKPGKEQISFSQSESYACTPRDILRGSLTVECAAVLPLFVMAVLTLASFMNCIHLQMDRNLELANRARQLSAAAGLAGTDEDIWIDLKKTESFRFPFLVIGVKDLKIACRARVYPWIGSDKSVGESGGEGGESDGEMVYVTDNEAVYHNHEGCTHLSLTIIRTTVAGAAKMRNSDGMKYRKCRGFPSGYTGDVYVTPDGLYMYPDTDYPGLTRHVHMVKKSDYRHLKQCERCAALDKKKAA